MNSCYRRVYKHLCKIAWCGVCLLCCCSGGLQAQPAIVRAEYYLDTDPGFGKARNIPISTPAVQLTNLQVSFDPDTITSGVHQFNVRALDSNGNWSLTQRLLFLKPYASGIAVPAAKIIYAEYFLDTDPGLGNAASVSVMAIANMVIPVDPDTLSSGVHQFNIRARDSLGNWSLTQRLLFLKPYPAGSISSPGKIVYAEWFIDNDPGFGQADSIAFTQASDINNIVIPINPATLTSGVHQFNIRARDSLGNWSLGQRILFIKPYASATSSPSPKIVYAEYFVDIDSGLGRARPIALTASGNISQAVISINPDSLLEGLHQFNIRARDSLGNWSLAQRLLFLKPYASAIAQPAPLLTYLEYYIDTDPGRGSGTRVPFTPAANLSNLLVPVDISALNLGPHRLYLRAKDTLGNWSLVNVDSFTKISPALSVGALSANTFCAGSNVRIPVSINTAIVTYAAGNVFTAQLSDSTAGFSNPVVIGTKSSVTADTINAAIPAAAPAGSGYRIRILSSLPADTSAANVLPLSIRRVPEQPFVIAGAAAVCADTQMYRVSAVVQNVQYAWQLSTGGSPLNTTGDTIHVLWTSTGLHTLKLISSNACGSGYRDSLQVTVFGAPPASQPLITAVGNQLSVPSKATVSGATGYQWYRDTMAIPGATDSFYHALINGQYTVRYSNPCGQGSAAAAVTVFNKLPQTISFSPLPNKTFGDAAFLLSASASSSLPVSFSLVSGPAVLSGDTLSITGAGTVTVQADQGGDNTYKRADSVRRSFTVNKAVQTISFAAIPDKTYGDSSFALSANASTGLPVSFSVSSGQAAVSGNVLTLTGAGAVTVTASQAGNQNYQAVQQLRTFCIAPITPDTIQGYTLTCASTQRYYIDSIPGASYSWTLSGGGTLSAATGGAISVNWTAIGIDTLKVTPSAGCSAATPPRRMVVRVDTAFTVGAVSNMYPSDSTELSTFPMLFSWMPGANAQLYDLYLWPADSAMPSVPAVANLSQIGYPVRHSMLAGFAAGKRYYWKVVAKNACRQAVGPVKTFIISQLPDLIVQSIGAPVSIFSGHNISVNITVKNSGLNGTGTVQWPDGIYLSTDSVLDKNLDRYLGGAFNLSALDTGKSYQVTINTRIPDSLTGDYYLIAEVNGTRALAEITFTNNSYYKPLRINLTPPADLQVKSVVIPNSAFSGQTVNLVYTVKNEGSGNTPVNAWKDYFYLSPNPVFDISQAMKIGDLTFSAGPLLPDSSYSRTASIHIPSQVFGNYYLYIVTDAAGQVFEFAAENNNTGRSDSIRIFLTPTPDYVPVVFTVPAEATNGEPISVDWSIRNDGVARQVADSVWKDALLISTDSNAGSANELASVLPPLSPHPLCNLYPLGTGGCRYVSPAMLHNDVYFNSATVTLPELHADSIYAFIQTDAANHIFEYAGEGNNILRKKIRLLHPDIRVDSVIAPAAGVAGQPVTIGWEIRNAGPGKVLSKNRTDRIYLSPATTFNPATAVLLYGLAYNTAIDSGAGLLQQQRPNLPASLSGTYYLFVSADDDNDIYEGGFEQNNLKRSGAIQITNPPAPDLQVMQILMSADTARADTVLAIAYEVKNIGAADMPGRSWKDKVFISKQALWNANAATLVKTISRAHTLLADSSYTVVDSVAITRMLLKTIQADSVPVYFYVQTDADNDINEGAAEGNNRLRSSAVYAMQGPRADLAVVSVSANTVASPGARLQVSYTVKNFGAGTASMNSFWHDGVFLSTDTLLSAGDLFIADVTRMGPLAGNASYSGTITFTVPNGLSGSYYLLVVTDHEGLLDDLSRTNNYKTILGSGGAPVSIVITTVNPADLIVQVFQAPSMAYSGQPVLLKWKVKNTGAGTTNAPAWTERAYLSLDTVADGTDIILGSYLRTGALSPGAFYADSLLVWLPISATGNFYVLLKTDNNNSVFEQNKEGNNVAASLIFLTPQPPSDLIVQQVVADSAVRVGDSVNVAFEVKNVGQNPAIGSYRAGIYASRDAVLDNNDLLLGNPVLTANLAPLAASADTVRLRLKGLVPGPYYILVKADLNNNIPEGNEGNNTGASAATLAVSMPWLSINVLTPDTLRNNEELYYRIEIPDSLQGETLMITLEGDSLRGVNELYASHDTIPTRADHQFAYDKPHSAQQQILIPELKKGTYYVLGYGAASGVPKQAITLLAERIPFTIRSIASNKGGNTGLMTAKISGARFVPGMIVRLLNTLLGTITAARITYSNSTTVFATFNLAGAPLGVYDVRVVKPGIDSVQLNGGFTVEVGRGGVTGGGGNNGFHCTIENTDVSDLLSTNVMAPDRVRIARPFPMTILYGNSGNVDIPAPQLLVVSPIKMPLGESSRIVVDILAQTVAGLGGPELDNLVFDLLLKLEDDEGPAGILMPGAVNSHTIYTGAYLLQDIQFKLINTAR